MIKSKEKRFFPCMTVKMLNYLVRQGFDCVKACDNDRDSHFKVFMFEDSDELQKHIRIYSMINKEL